MMDQHWQLEPALPAKKKRGRPKGSKDKARQPAVREKFPSWLPVISEWLQRLRSTASMVRQTINNVSDFFSKYFWHAWQLDNDLADDEYDRLNNDDDITHEMLLDLYNIEKRLQSAGKVLSIVYYIKLSTLWNDLVTPLTDSEIPLNVGDIPRLPTRQHLEAWRSIEALKHQCVIISENFHVNWTYPSH